MLLNSLTIRGMWEGCTGYIFSEDNDHTAIHGHARRRGYNANTMSYCLPRGKYLVKVHFNNQYFEKRVEINGKNIEVHVGQLNVK